MLDRLHVVMRQENDGLMDISLEIDDRDMTRLMRRLFRPRAELVVQTTRSGVHRAYLDGNSHGQSPQLCPIRDDQRAVPIVHGLHGTRYPEDGGLQSMVSDRNDACHVTPLMSQDIIAFQQPNSEGYSGTDYTEPRAQGFRVSEHGTARRNSTSCHVAWSRELCLVYDNK